MKNKQTSQFVLLALLFIVSQCTPRPIFESGRHYTKKITPPGTVQVDSNLYFDRFEMSNIGYQEYLYWIQRVFGEKSNTYQGALPDTNVWLDLDPRLEYNPIYSFQHPRYNEHPIVGISYTQAENYCQWRSDRVFEQILISQGELQHNPKQNQDSYFSIDNYFEGRYENKESSAYFQYYPQYDIPKAKDYRTAMAKNNPSQGTSVAKINPQKSYVEVTHQIDSILIVSQTDTVHFQLWDVVFSPTVGIHVTPRKDQTIYHLQDNVEEYVADNKSLHLGSWHDHFVLSVPTAPQPYQSSNAWTGFRCVAKWKKWEKE